MGQFSEQISNALGKDNSPTAEIHMQSHADWPACFKVADLATDTFVAAMQELAAFTGAQNVEIDGRLVSIWFQSTLRPIGWQQASSWDALAGDYATNNGWIRLHTNAPHHKTAALRALALPVEAITRAELADAVASWPKTQLETAIVNSGGAAAAMHSLDEWAAHPQGRAVAQEPLIAWQTVNSSTVKPITTAPKILDLTRVLAGPVATRLLAGFGAKVLRVDPPWWNEPGLEPEVTLGKRCTGLDLTQSEDRKIFETLLKDADILVHGYRSGALQNLGYGAETLRQIAPELIDVSLTAYGWSGPWSDRRGFDSLVQMSSGIASEGMHRTGAAAPVPLPVQALDHATGYLMAAAAVRALRLRQTTGNVLSARLSLARTAALLISAGATGQTGSKVSERAEDLSQHIEQTGWGPANRVAFPARLVGHGPTWTLASGPLRSHSAQW